MTVVTLIAAVGSNGVIGTDNTMPWHLHEDFAFFKRTTMGHAMLMGRRTFDSIGRALPGRRTIVITRQAGWSHPGVETSHSFAEALALAGPADEVFVCGGGEIYAAAMGLAGRLLITEVDQAPMGDVTFPVIEPGIWQETSRQQRQGFSWVSYERRNHHPEPGRQAS